MKTFLLIVTFLLLGSAAQAATRIVAVNGSATINAMPDIIRVDYYVTAISEGGGSAAKVEVDEIAARSIEALVALGVDKGSVTSSSLSVYPFDEYDANDNEIESTKSRVSRRLELVLLDIKLYNKVIQALVDAGVTHIERVSPDVSNYDELKMEALAAASANAKKEAEFLASNLGASIGNVHQIGNQKLRRNFSMEEIVVTARKTTESRSIPYEFEPGTVKVSADIYVEFELE
jgi:uncharacterized protein YggE